MDDATAMEARRRLIREIAAKSRSQHRLDTNRIFTKYERYIGAALQES